MIPLNPTSQSTRKSDTWPPPPYDEGTWREAWAVISRMMDLRQIRVHLSGQGIPLRKDPFRHLLEPLHEIRHAAVFELTVASGPDVEFINAPFKIFRASE